jgi:hypothetical protein
MISPVTHIWLFVFAYTLAMLMLVAAAILRRICSSPSL